MRRAVVVVLLLSLAAVLAVLLAPSRVRTFDVEPYRERAGVPAMSWSAVTRDEEVFGGGGDEPFEAASIAKIVVAMAVFQLVEDKRVDLDRDVSTYLGFLVRHPAAAAPITLRMLLAHRASIRDHDLEHATRKKPLGTFIGEYVDDPASYEAAPPGEAYVYSNAGYALAAYVVEKVSGAPFEEVARARVFAPLAMTRTSYEAEQQATPHVLRNGEYVPVDPADHAVFPASDLRSTGHDLGRLARCLLRDGELDGVRVLAKTSVTAMESQHLGLQVVAKRNDRELLGHEGEDLGTSAVLAFDPSRGAGAVVLASGNAFASGDEARAAAVADLVFDLISSANAE